MSDHQQQRATASASARRRDVVNNDTEKDGKKDGKNGNKIRKGGERYTESGKEDTRRKECRAGTEKGLEVDTRRLRGAIPMDLGQDLEHISKELRAELLRESSPSTAKTMPGSLAQLRQKRGSIDQAYDDEEDIHDDHHEHGHELGGKDGETNDSSQGATAKSSKHEKPNLKMQTQIQAQHSSSDKVRRPKKAHHRSRTADASTIRRSVALANEREKLANLHLESTVGEQSEGSAKKDGKSEDRTSRSLIRTRMRRVASEPRVVRDLDLTQRGLAKLESTDFTEVYLTSDDEAHDNHGGSSVDGPDADGTTVPNGLDNVAKHGETGDSTSPFSMRWKKSRRSGVGTKKKKRNRRHRGEPVQHSYFVDDKGEVRDEYGFRIEDTEDKYLCPPSSANGSHAPVPHDAKKRILGKEAGKRRQRRAWGEVLDDFAGNLTNIPADALERWRKYYATDLPPDSADRYLLQISSPTPAAVPPEVLSPTSAHRRQFSLASSASQDSIDPAEKDSPRRGSRSLSFGFHVETVVRKFLVRGHGKRKNERGEEGAGAGPSSSGEGQDTEMSHHPTAATSSLSSSSGHHHRHHHHHHHHHQQHQKQKQNIHSERSENAGNIGTEAPSGGGLSTAGMQNSSSNNNGASGESNRHVGSGGNSGVGGVHHNQVHAMEPSATSSQIKHITHVIRHFGIPPRLRREMWLMCSGALEKQRNSGPTEQYEYLVACATSGDRAPEMAEIIERDLHRTFPTNYHFENEEGITRMRRVLLAYSLRNRAIGYCQSMNFLVAVLLLHMDENLAFWALASIVEDLVPGHYTKQMTGMHVDQRVFESLVKQRLPRLHAHLESLEFPLEFVTYQWFLCLFVNSLPLETTLRIWDCFLHEGVKALFRSGLAILMVLQKEIISCGSFQEVYACMSLADNLERKSQLTGDRVLRLAYDSMVFRSFPSSKISQLRSMHLPVVLENLGHQIDWTDYTSGQSDHESQGASRPTVTRASEAVEEKNYDSTSQCADKTKPPSRCNSSSGTHVSPSSQQATNIELDCHTNGSAHLPDSSDESEKDSSDDVGSKLSHTRSEGMISREDSLDNAGSEHPIQESMSGSFHDFPQLRQKVARRPSTSFKYQLRVESDPMSTISQLGIRSQRPASFSMESPSKLDLRHNHGSFDRHAPRRASTNSPPMANYYSKSLRPGGHRLRNTSPAWRSLDSTYADDEGDNDTFYEDERYDDGDDEDDGLASSSEARAGAKPNSSDHDKDDAGSFIEVSSQQEDYDSSHISGRTELSQTLTLSALTSNADSNEDIHASSPRSHRQNGDIQGGGSAAADDDEEEEEDDEEDDDDDDDDASDLPSEFSGLLPSLAYVMSARQIDLNERDLPRAATSGPDASLKSPLYEEVERSSSHDLSTAMTSASFKDTPLRTKENISRTTVDRWRDDQRPSTAPASSSVDSVSSTSMQNKAAASRRGETSWANDAGIRVRGSGGTTSDKQERSQLDKTDSSSRDPFADDAGIRVTGVNEGASSTPRHTVSHDPVITQRSMSTKSNASAMSARSTPSSTGNDKYSANKSATTDRNSNSNSDSINSNSGVDASQDHQPAATLKKKKRGLFARIGWQHNRKSL